MNIFEPFNSTYMASCYCNNFALIISRFNHFLVLDSHKHAQWLFIFRKTIILRLFCLPTFHKIRPFSMFLKLAIGTLSYKPDILMSLNIDFVKLHCFCPVTFYICFHFHGNMSGQNWKQQAFLKLKALILNTITYFY